MALPEHVKVTLVFGHNDQVATCGLYYSLDSGNITVSNITAVCDELKAAWRGVVIKVISTECRFDGVEVRYHAGAIALDGRSSDAPDAGLGTGDILPEEDCVVLRRHTGLAGRNKRGRIFFPFVCESNQSASKLSAGAISDYKDIAYKMKVPMVLAVTGVTMVPQQPDFKGSTFDPVVETAVVVDVLNRRDRRSPKRILAIATPP